MLRQLASSNKKFARNRKFSDMLSQIAQIVVLSLLWFLLIFDKVQI